ncbi:hypothetical protein ND748_05495 [Frankia sp. AiPs1]|uniref:hypothetical protein n=1 Tax=Frankia sp. AiPs1 TaxID=573493 RepID=UPI002042EA19|nr:hypothetical protein [Frankia sp. AiPs1]MCM3921132.1 hypothetical protein [Frankia sp. AiPs1]
MTTPSPLRVSPVLLDTPAGVWHLARTTSDSDGMSAMLQTNAGRGPRHTVYFHAQGDMWEVEERLGFALPAAIRKALRRAAPQQVAPSLDHEVFTDTFLPFAMPQGDYRPRRASRVTIAGQTPTKYGRLLHADSPLRRWEHDTCRIDIVADPGMSSGHPSRALGYRLWQDDHVVFAGGGARIPASFDATSDAALREIAQYALLRRPGTARQRALLDQQRPALAAALAPPTEPYPHGTHVLVRHAHLPGTVAGTVVGHVSSRTGTADYVWRPDVFDLPGHPYAHQPEQTLRSPAALVEPSLGARGIEVAGPDAQVVLTYGARIRTIDHPDIDTGTVLRAFMDDNSTIHYEIRPDDNHTTIRLPKKDVEALAGTAWPTVDAVLTARSQTDVPVTDREAIVALREIAVTYTNARGAIIPYLLREPSLDNLLDPGSPDFLPVLDTAPSPQDLPRPQVHSDVHTIHVLDPDHGLFAIPRPLLEAALTTPPERLAALLHDLADLHLTGRESPVTLASLTVTWLPDLVTAPPRPDEPGSPTVAPAVPDDAVPFDPGAAEPALDPDL